MIKISRARTPANALFLLRWGTHLHYALSPKIQWKEKLALGPEGLLTIANSAPTTTCLVPVYTMLYDTYSLKLCHTSFLLLVKYPIRSALSPRLVRYSQRRCHVKSAPMPSESDPARKAITSASCCSAPLLSCKPRPRLEVATLNPKRSGEGGFYTATPL